MSLLTKAHTKQLVICYVIVPGMNLEKDVAVSII